MFILRSAFWLTLAFLVIGGSRNVDLGAAASDLSARAMQAGQQLIITQILSDDCKTVECFGGNAAAAVTSAFPSSDSPMQDSSHSPVPVPRPRPARMG